ncbi:universal stress protein [Natronobacterium gregoryi]|uniref:Universal stress protein n=2 Tax=Natronobacterium gregoryi TaxID=44930 RepID=L0AE35_NATGS|nr:universal stress protein [Natronobacterium gregoryi]AFZ71684.1 universal stress protein UspA-like protein [Natronobacterium gregoryi SP2]ELY72744.1 UspA domain-containing protein [Natronobacterium gregoryi SP2]PLK20268.1 universal stress protein [Natronobacterium gregoryi SP2]SFJ25098.1 Nucleotide-binding universal stress protein, UspA family [Natronobacterium gregoryi]
MNSILVPVDGSAAAGHALEQALQLADESDESVEVDVLTVVDTTTTPIQFGVTDVVEIDRARMLLVDEIAAVSDDHDAEIHGAVRRGRPARIVTSYADERDIDLIVLGRTEHSSVGETLFGSTADRVVERAPVPVLVVPETEADDDRPLSPLDWCPG